MGNSMLTKKTPITLGAALAVLLIGFYVFRWVDAEHDSIKVDCKTTTDSLKTDVQDDIKEMKESVIRVENRVDEIKTLLIKWNGGTG